MADKDDTITGDFCMMEEISENAMFEKLKERFMDDKIYTNIGEVVVSVNPYKSIPHLYSPDCVRSYKDKQMFEVAPHIYAISNDVYWNLLKNKENQCVIISGESGAGKTEASKILLRYLSEISKKADEVSRIARKLVESNPILEAFGNAKTLRNDNSSRFGKYMDIEFDFDGSPIGGKVTNYLLEKSRIIGREKDERCFHVFYQLLAGLESDQLKQLHLSSDPSSFEFLRRSGCYTVARVDDKEDFALMRRSLDTLGFSKDDQDSLWRIAGGILLLGNIEFEATAAGSSVKNKGACKDAADVLGVSADELENVLTHRTIVTGTGQKAEQLTSPLDPIQAAATRDSLAKSIYQRTFDWLVEGINERIGRKETSKSLVVGVLDIYGFEVFPNNGFEQFCINLCNEKLQQVFIEVVLKREQETYVREGIEWKPVEYFNNRVICELLEGPPKTKDLAKTKEVGLIPLMDEIGTMRDSTDMQLLERLNTMYKTHDHFHSSETSKDTKIGKTKFIIQHYAGHVDYNIEGFLEKNKDTVFRDLRICMSTSSNTVLKLKYPPVTLDDDKKRPLTAGMQFKNSLANLMETLLSCDAHYIRCIKPNETKASRVIDEDRVRHQLRYLGLMENVRVRRAGFAFKRPYSFFLWRYKCIGKETWPHCKGTPQKDSESILRQFNVPPEEYRLGKTMIFIRSPKTLVLLEEARNKALPRIATLIQKNFRRYVERSEYKRYRAAQTLQTVIRFRNAREIFIVFQPATLLIQKLWKAYEIRPWINALNENLGKVSEDSTLGRTATFPKAPAILEEGASYVQKIFKAWRYRNMVAGMSSDNQQKIKTKILAYDIFHGKKPYDMNRQFGNCKFLENPTDPNAQKFTTTTQKEMSSPKTNPSNDTKILFSDYCTKISPKYKGERKAIIVCDRSIAFLDPKKFTRTKEFILGGAITEIEMTTNKGEQFIVLKQASPAPDFAFELAESDRKREILSEFVVLLINTFKLQPSIVKFNKDLHFNLTRTAKKPVGEDCTTVFELTTDPKKLKTTQLMAFKAGKKGQHNVFYRP